MLPEDLIRSYLKQLAAKAQMGYLAKKGWHQKILVRCRKVRICPHCNAQNGNENIHYSLHSSLNNTICTYVVDPSTFIKKLFEGVVKKASGAILKIVHAIAPPSHEAVAEVIKHNKELAQLLPKCKQV